MLAQHGHDEPRRHGQPLARPSTARWPTVLQLSRAGTGMAHDPYSSAMREGAQRRGGSEQAKGTSGEAAHREGDSARARGSSDERVSEVVVATS